VASSWRIRHKLPSSRLGVVGALTSCFSLARSTASSPSLNVKKADSKIAELHHAN